MQNRESANERRTRPSSGIAFTSRSINALPAPKSRSTGVSIATIATIA